MLLATQGLYVGAYDLPGDKHDPLKGYLAHKKQPLPRTQCPSSLEAAPSCPTPLAALKMIGVERARGEKPASPLALSIEN